MSTHEPLIPPEVDLRDFPFMPLDVRRFRDSRLVAVRSPEEVLAAILLWSASWHQQPAASLPNDELELSQLAGYGRAVKEFRRVKEGALHGLVLCSDGRWYHPVVAEKAAEAWNGRLEMEWRKSADRVRKENKERAERNEEALRIPPRPALLSPEYVNGIPVFDYHNSAGIPSEGLRNSRRKGKGEGKGTVESGKGQWKTPDSSLCSESSAQKVPDVSAAQTPPPKPEKKSKPEPQTAEAWAAYTEAYRQRYGTDPTRNAVENASMAKFISLVPLAEAPEIAAFYVRHNKAWYVSHQHSVKFLMQDAAGLRTQWLAGRPMTDTEARQTDRTQATGNVFGKLIQEAEEREAHARQ